MIVAIRQGLHDDGYAVSISQLCRWFGIPRRTVYYKTTKKLPTVQHSPEQNGMVERVIRTLKDQCVHRHRFETLQHASRVIGDWIGFYNKQRPHQALGMRTPAEACALAA